MKGPLPNKRRGPFHGKSTVSAAASRRQHLSALCRRSLHPPGALRPRQPESAPTPSLSRPTSPKADGVFSPKRLWSISGLKGFALHAVLRKKRGFPLRCGRAARCRRLACSLFKGNTLQAPPVFPPSAGMDAETKLRLPQAWTQRRNSAFRRRHSAENASSAPRPHPRKRTSPRRTGRGP